jgi:transducin (beta)-like 1
LNEHTEAVYSVTFTPDCTFLASGSFDKNVLIWSMKVILSNQDGSLVGKYAGNGGVFEIAYSPDGDKIAVCYSDTKVFIFNLKLVVLYVGKEQKKIS